MGDVTREQWFAYLDDALDEIETARIERLLRESKELQQELARIREERDRGEHSLGAVWRRDGLSCPSREELNSFVHAVLDGDFQKYVEFHVKTIGCVRCGANVDDLRERKSESAGQAKRRKRYFETSARLLKDGRE